MKIKENKKPKTVDNTDPAHRVPPSPKKYWYLFI